MYPVCTRTYQSSASRTFSEHSGDGHRAALVSILQHVRVSACRHCRVRVLSTDTGKEHSTDAIHSRVEVTMSKPSCKG